MKNMSKADASSQPQGVRIVLFGKGADMLRPLIQRYTPLKVVVSSPDVVVCYGGDGTLIAAELRWPGVPKVPILNSRRGHRCIPKSPEEVIEALANNALISTQYTKLECAVLPLKQKGDPDFVLTCLNEVNVHMGRINSAVRFKLWINNVPFDRGVEIVSDGFVACTAFGSNAYFKAITRGIFTQGIGVAFKATTYAVDHIVLPEDTHVRFQITRGPATLAFDNSPEFIGLDAGDALTVCKHAQSATVLTCAPVIDLDEPF